MTHDAAAREENLARLRTLVRGPDSNVAVFCTHDAVEYVAMTAFSARAEHASPVAAPPN
jgi:hypothetical protein